jgi:hypothetical protein
MAAALEMSVPAQASNTHQHTYFLYLLVKMSPILNYNVWTPSSLADLELGACGRGKSCNAIQCLGTDENTGTFTTWVCAHGAWFIPNEQSVAGPDHTAQACRGDCATHPLMVGDNLLVHQLLGTSPNGTWGDLVHAEEVAAWLAESPAQTAARMLRERQHAEANRQGRIRFSVNKKEDKWCSRGQMKFRVPRCCKYESLFLARTCAKCEHQVPAGQTHCQAANAVGVPCGEELAACWNHKATRTCIYVHSDEQQWAAACAGVLCYDRESQRFHLKSDAPPVANRFEACARDARRGGQSRSGAQSGGGGAGGARNSGQSSRKAGW